MDEDKRMLAALAVPDLELPASRAVSAPRGAHPGHPAPPARIASSFDGDDGLGMELERDVTGLPGLAPSVGSGRASNAADGIPLARGPVAHVPSGLDVAYRRLDPTRDQAPRGPSALARVAGPTVALAAFALASAALLQTVHRPRGVTTASLLPHAFDGTSPVASGAVALTGMAAAVALGYVGARPRTRSWWLLAAAGATLLLSLAMVTVTLASTGDSVTPPDGALLVPWLCPLALLLAGIDLLRRAARRLTNVVGSRRLGGVPLAVVAAILVFAAIETSPFVADLLPRSPW